MSVEEKGDVRGADRRSPTRFDPLWEEPESSRVGRPARVSRPEVVAAAVALADEQGLGKVSMRAVARSLGVGTMTLYSHVPGREELIDLMIESAYGELELPGPALDWRPALETYARAQWTMLRAHPWLLDINPWRMPLGPHVLTAQDVDASSTPASAGRRSSRSSGSSTTRSPVRRARPSRRPTTSGARVRTTSRTGRGPPASGSSASTRRASRR